LAGASGTVPPLAQVIPSTTSDVTDPHLPEIRTGTTLAPWANPATPFALLVTATIAPARLVPCQEEGRDRIRCAAGVCVPPIAGVARVVVGAVAIVGANQFFDEVVPGKDVGFQVAVSNDPRIDHGDHHTATVGEIPGVDGTGGLARKVPLIGKLGVVGNQAWLHDRIDFDGRDVGVGRDASHQLFRFGPVQRDAGADHVCAHRHGAHVMQCLRWLVDAPWHGGNDALQDSFQARRAEGRCAASAQLDDEAIGAHACLQGRRIHDGMLRGSGPTLRREQGGCQSECESPAVTHVPPDAEPESDISSSRCACAGYSL
jgi:hypothetical protein